MARTAENYRDAMIRSLPQGVAFAREPAAQETAEQNNAAAQGTAEQRSGAPVRDGLIQAIAEELAREDEAIDRFAAEADPASTNALLPEWERDYGLPECDHQKGLTRQERLAALNEKIDRVGSLNPKAIEKLCADLGYKVRVTERRPFMLGISRVGEHLGKPHVRYWWTVMVLEPRLTYFRVGSSRVGDRLLSIRRAEDLECVLQKINHSDVKLTVSYSGV